jgi:hypothetical protein
MKGGMEIGKAFGGYGLLSGFPLEAVVWFAEHKLTGQWLPLEQVRY